LFFDGLDLEKCLFDVLVLDGAGLELEDLEGFCLQAKVVRLVVLLVVWVVVWIFLSVFLVILLEVLREVFLVVLLEVLLVVFLEVFLVILLVVLGEVFLVIEGEIGLKVLWFKLSLIGLHFHLHFFIY
jgi:hypothetical protein